MLCFILFGCVYLAACGALIALCDIFGLKKCMFRDLLIGLDSVLLCRVMVCVLVQCFSVRFVLMCGLIACILMRCFFVYCIVL